MPDSLQKHVKQTYLLEKQIYRMPYILALEGVGRENKSVGAKAANLGELMRAGFPVPAGFVLTAEAFEYFLNFNKLDGRIAVILDGMDVENAELLKQKSNEIENLIVDAEVSDAIRRGVRDFYENIGVGKEARLAGAAALDMIRAGRDRVFVSVRSSPLSENPLIASFAGQMKTYINVNGTDRLIEAIKRCWASAYSPRAIFYREKHKIGGKPVMGVVVQKMVDAEKSGGIFTADPITNDKTKVIIEAAWGLGLAVSTGLVTPDKYIIDKQTGQVLEKRIARKTALLRRDHIGKTVKESVLPEKIAEQTLSETEINRLWEISKKVESLYGGQQQDLEWSIERGRLFLLQARPITTLGKTNQLSLEQTGTPREPMLTGCCASPGYASGKAKIIHSVEELPRIEQGDIIVSKMIIPEFAAYMDKAAAIVTDEGGITSQPATVSRELGIPSIVGADKATELLIDGKEIIVDATFGRVYPVDATATPYTIAMQQIEGSSKNDFITATEIKVNISFLADSEKIPKSVDGVGLLRSEYLVSEAGKNPLHLARSNPQELAQTLVDRIGRVASSVYPKQVWYRNIDAKPNEFQGLDVEQEPQETNPILGWRGIRRSLGQQELLKCELEAIKTLHNSGLTNMCLLLPFIVNVEELRAVKNMLEFPLKLGIIVETPAAAIEIEKFCKEGIDFVSIGSNDLTQLILGADRGNPKTSNIYSELHPSVMSLIKKTIETCKKYGVKTSICGEGPNNSDELVERLVEFGIDSISVELDAIERVKTVVSRVEKRLLLNSVRGEQNKQP